MILLTPPIAEPVTVSDAKLALRIDDDRFDLLLPGLISAARALAEQETGRQLVEQTWRFERRDWPAENVVLPVYRATDATVSYWDGSAWDTVPGTDYVFAPDAQSGTGTCIAPVDGWPALGELTIGPRVRIDLTAGVATADAATVPDGIKTFIIALVGQIIQSPELSAHAAVQAHPLLARLLDPWRLYG